MQQMRMTAPPHEVGDLWSPCGYIIAFYRVLIVVLIRTRRTHSTLHPRHERNHGSGFELSSDLYTQSRREIWKNQDAVKGKTFRSQLNSGDQWCAQVLHTTSPHKHKHAVCTTHRPKSVCVPAKPTPQTAGIKVFHLYEAAQWEAQRITQGKGRNIHS